MNVGTLNRSFNTEVNLTLENKNLLSSEMKYNMNIKSARINRVEKHFHVWRSLNSKQESKQRGKKGPESTVLIRD